MRGVKCATAFFITRADLIPCGRNILPTEEITGNGDALHKRALDDVERLRVVDRVKARLLSVQDLKIFKIVVEDLHIH